MLAVQLMLCRSTGRCDVLGLKGARSCSEGQVIERASPSVKVAGGERLPCEHAMATRKIQDIRLCEQSVDSS